MAPIKMKDGRIAYPIRSNKDLAAAQARGCVIEFTGCGCAYDLPRHDEHGSAGWIKDPHPESICDLPLLDRGCRARGVLGEAKPTLWQRIRSWFA